MYDTTTLGGVERPVEQLRLKGWLELNSIQRRIDKAIERKHIDGIADGIIAYVSIAFKMDNIMLSDLPWLEVVTAYMAAVAANKLSVEIPMMKSMLKDFVGENWDYEGREFYHWSHLFAENYGWNIYDVANLRVEDAVKLLQEILVASQLQKEWEWMCSQNSVGYDAATKKSKAIELPRPDWMKEQGSLRVGTRPMPEKFVPPGIVIKLEDRPDVKH